MSCLQWCVAILVVVDVAYLQKILECSAAFETVGRSLENLATMFILDQVWWGYKKIVRTHPPWRLWCQRLLADPRLLPRRPNRSPFLDLQRTVTVRNLCHWYRLPAPLRGIDLWLWLVGHGFTVLKSLFNLPWEVRCKLLSAAEVAALSFPLWRPCLGPWKVSGSLLEIPMLFGRMNGLACPLGYGAGSMPLHYTAV